jgi:hypothetical protein
MTNGKYIEKLCKYNKLNILLAIISMLNKDALLQIVIINISLNLLYIVVDELDKSDETYFDSV